jgi:hypothetical protein
MQTRTLILSGLLALFLLGCVSIDYTQKLDRDGNSLITQKIDLSALIAYANQSGGSDSDLSTICANMTSGQPGVNCTYADGVVTLAKAVKATDGMYIFNKTSEFPYNIYTLEVRRLPEIVESESVPSGGLGGDTSTTSDFKSASSKTAAASLKTVGASISYTVEMPGEIVSAENGEMEGPEGKKVAKYDVLGLMSDGEYIVVKSKELDLVSVGMAIVGIVVLVGAIVVAFVLFKASRK